MDFALSKILWGLADPAHAVVIALLVAVWLLGRRSAAARRWGRGMTAAAALFLLATATTPLADLIVTPLEDRFPPLNTLPEKAAGIIVLGGAVSPPLSRARGQPALNAAAERLIAFADLARRYPESRLIASGGSGMLFNQEDREDAPTALTLAQMGIDPARVVYENRSRNTWENALFSRELMNGGEGEWILVTSAMHMPRAVGIFRQLGLRPIPYPVDYRTRGGGRPWLRADLAANLEVLTYGAREWIGLAAYRLAGRVGEIFPGPI